MKIRALGFAISSVAMASIAAMAQPNAAPEVTAYADLIFTGGTVHRR